jgi:hypothetical protein
MPYCGKMWPFSARPEPAGFVRQSAPEDSLVNAAGLSAARLKRDNPL